MTTTVKKQAVKKVEHYVGQMLDLIMIKSNKNNIPISRTEEGMICIIDKNTKGFFPYNSTWECEVIEVCEKKLIIKPLHLIKTAEENEKIFKEKLSSLPNILKKKEKHEKKTYDYQYNRKG